MCGIVGVFPHPKSIQKLGLQKEAIETAIRLLTSSLLLYTEERGKDASGLFIGFWNGEWSVLKQPVPTSDFVINVGQSKYTAQKEGASYSDVMRGWHYRATTTAPTALVFGHARKGTKGSEYKDCNNHPIAVEKRIFGVHNGSVRNDNRIFALHPGLKRVGEVDSEAIFQLIYALAPEAPPNLPFLKSLDTRLRGEYAFLYTNSRFPGVVGGIRRDRPIELALCPQLGLMLLASERGFLEKSIGQYNRTVVSIGLGKTLPLLTSAGVSHRYISDGTAFCFDLSKDTDNLEACYESSSLPSKIQSDDKDYDCTAGSTTTTTPAATTYQTTGYPGGSAFAGGYEYKTRAATFVDTTDYSLLTPEGEIDSSDDPPAAGDQVKVTVLQEVEPQEPEPDVDDLYAKLREEAVDVLAEGELPEGCLWVNRLTAENIYEELGIPEAAGTIDERVLITLVSLIGERSFADGYALGLMRELGVSAAGDGERGFRRNRRKAAAFVANIKSLLLAALAGGDFLTVQDEGGVLIDGTLLDMAAELNPRFDEPSSTLFLNSPGTQANAQRAVALAEQYGLTNNDEDEEEDETEGESAGEAGASADPSDD